MRITRAIVNSRSHRVRQYRTVGVSGIQCIHVYIYLTSGSSGDNRITHI